MTDRHHAMTLEDFAALSGNQVPPDAGRCTVITPALATALNRLLDQVSLECEQLHPDDPVHLAYVDVVELLGASGRLASHPGLREADDAV